jgi:two-component sensor histidine kinase/PAS domain-containing protein
VTLLENLLSHRGELPEDAVDHLQALLGEWQTLADMSFADLLLWVRCELVDGSPGYLCVGQMRPYTTQTIYTEDLVGQVFPVSARPMVGRALTEQRVIRDADPDWSTGVPVREEAVPIRFGDRVIAVITRESNVSTARAPSQLELTYLQTAGELAQMMAEGTLPHPGASRDERELAPRVGDGIIRVDADGVVGFASPNAISAYRRLGSLDSVMGTHLEQLDPEPRQLLESLRTGIPVDAEVEVDDAVVIRRFIPLIASGRIIGALLLVREVTELRQHERALMVKDATIREIHHRVKNNLQTVAALLRLQARRLGSDEARAALGESVRRITSISLVHETLSEEARQRVPFAKITRRIVDMLSQGLVGPDVPIDFDLTGDPDELSAEVATPLALVLAELLQNCVEHAFPIDGPPPAGDARVEVHFARTDGQLTVRVTDNGVGLPAGAGLDDIANLGLRIARTLLETELSGTFDVSRGDPGTTVELLVPLRSTGPPA